MRSGPLQRQVIDAPHDTLPGILDRRLDLAALRDRYRTATPFPHICIDGFLDPRVAAALEAAFPDPAADCWSEYNNPIEKKLACNRLDKLPSPIRSALLSLNGEGIRSGFSALTGIGDLLADPEFHGGGIHCIKRGGKLDMHIDYSLHPKLGLQRRLNLIVYLNRNWDPSWGGALELWEGRDGRPARCVRRILPIFNRAVIFDTGDRSFHGHPEPLLCPDGHARKSVAVYYLTKPRPAASPHSRAQFFKRPGDPDDPAIERIRQLRAHSATAALAYRTEDFRKPNGE